MSVICSFLQTKMIKRETKGKQTQQKIATEAQETKIPPKNEPTLNVTQNAHAYKTNSRSTSLQFLLQYSSSNLLFPDETVAQMPQNAAVMLPHHFNLTKKSGEICKSWGKVGTGRRTGNETLIQKISNEFNGGKLG